MKSSSFLTVTLSFAATIFLAPHPIMAENAVAFSQQQDETTIEGTVISSTPNTMVVRTDDGVYQLFAFDPDTVRPPSIPTGSRVRATSIPGDEPGFRIANTIAITAPAAPPQEGVTEPPPAIPASLRRLEREIERQVRRYGIGVRAGVALDPELVLVGVHARFAPVFDPNVSIRPNVEFAIGEVTALIALNLEAVYRLPFASRQGRWATYFGAGPGFNFLHQSFERFTDEDANSVRRIDFGEFRYSTALNIFGGIQYRGGTFIELKSSVYSASSPSLRLILGYNF